MSQRIEQPSFDTAPAGSIRFNTDSRKMELYNGEAWWEIDATSPNLHTGGTRGIWAGGRSQDIIDYYINNLLKQKNIILDKTDY